MNFIPRSDESVTDSTTDGNSSGILSDIPFKKFMPRTRMHNAIATVNVKSTINCRALCLLYYYHRVYRMDPDNAD